MKVTQELFHPSVEMAVQTSVRLNKPLLVYVSGDDDALFEEMNITSELWSYFIAVKIDPTTSDYHFFNQHFPNLPLPSVLIIKQGKVLATLTHININHLNDTLIKYLPVDGKSPSSVTSSVVTKPPSVDSKTKPITKPVTKPKIPVVPDRCVLSIRLLDGTNLKHEFKPTDTLDDVRKWLDTESDTDILPKTTMPSFASPGHLQPTNYSFQSPSVPRITYSDDQEFKTLSELHLVPRSVITLKPVFNDIIEAYQPTTMMNNLTNNITNLANAFYSFFDYSNSLEDNDDEILHDHDHKVGSLPSKSKVQVLSIDKTKPHTMIHFEDEPRRSSSPNIVEDKKNNTFDTPRVVHERSITRIETIHDETTKLDNKKIVDDR